MTWVVVFDYPEGRMYAGKYKDGLGWAPQLETAIMFDEEESAVATLANGYGDESRKFGRVVALEELR